MGLGASQQCVVIGCNVFVKSFSELQNHSNISKCICSMYLWQNMISFLLKMGITWLRSFLKPKTPPNRVFWLIKYKDLKHTYRNFLGNLVHTNPNIPLNFYWAKIWCILIDKRSQCTWIRVTSSTELKSSSPFVTPFTHVSRYPGAWNKRQCNNMKSMQKLAYVNMMYDIWYVICNRWRGICNVLKAISLPFNV